MPMKYKKNVKITGCAMKRQWNLHYGNDFCELNCLSKYIMSFEIELSDLNSFNRRYCL